MYITGNFQIMVNGDNQVNIVKWDLLTQQYGYVVCMVLPLRKDNKNNRDVKHPHKEQPQAPMIISTSTEVRALAFGNPFGKGHADMIRAGGAISRWAGAVCCSC